ncbi:hypothetical protein Vqi01_47980 [Micromonospora qiuiae]|uniref:PPE family domain-containing protein n=1 Tax=Micromonospora qiuiae TaxID=502268 RepID=A0ABQ4JJG1_9ACTN|nr:hypothetical protein [Micromonospora qiuiae]GIJ29636.1 hypothetical protein Vqi01_47980 [Micromonospora qiuiae]
MTDDYYGWQPISYHPYSGVSDDYAADRAAQAAPYEPTAWDSVNIEQMWEYVRKESDERTTALAETWRRAASLLQSTRDNLKRHADALDARWKSPAARVFMSRVGATLHSLDEWKNVATNNAAGLEQLASKIETSQRDMKKLWEEYRAEQIRQSERRKKDEGFQAADLIDWIPGVTGNDGKSYEDVQNEYHQRAKNIAKPLADLYIDVYISNLSRGGKFKGPTDAVATNPNAIPRPVRPGKPGTPGTPPGKPKLKGGRPDQPNRPDMPNRPDSPNQPDLGDRPTAPTTPPPPNLPEGVGLAGTATPTAPTGPAPAPPPTVNTPSTPPPPGPAVPPVAGPGPRPTNPGLSSPGSGGRPNAPRTTLPGSGGPPTTGSRGPAPNRPTLPGAGGPGSGSGAPPPGGRRGQAPNRPTLPGNTGGGRPGLGSSRPGTGARPGVSATPPPSSPRLPGSTARPGQRGTAPGTPPSAGTPLTGRPGKPPVTPTGKPATPATGPGAPGSGARPDLSGRAGSARPAPATGPAPSLGGRRGGPVTPGPHKAVPHAGQQETWEYGDGDELWDTESSAVGVVEAPTEQRPREQGRALGQS